MGIKSMRINTQSNTVYLRCLISGGHAVSLCLALALDTIYINYKNYTNS